MTAEKAPPDALLEKLMNEMDDAAEAFWTGQDYDATDHEKLKAARQSLRDHVNQLRAEIARLGGHVES